MWGINVGEVVVIMEQIKDFKPLCGWDMPKSLIQFHIFSKLQLYSISIM